MLFINLLYLMQGQITFIEFLQYTLFAVVAVVIALSVHECCHALVAYWFGDKTAKYQGRITLNPFRHMNWIGAVMLLVLGFGWANPVIVDSRNFKKPRLGMALTAAAGPASNLLTALLFSFIYVLIYGRLDIVTNTPFWGNFATLFSYIILINITFAVFNLIPFPPLDGSKIIGELLPLKYRYKYYSLQKNSMIFFLAIILFSRSANIFSFFQGTISNAFIDLCKLILGVS